MCSVGERFEKMFDILPKQRMTGCFLLVCREFGVGRELSVLE